MPASARDFERHAAHAKPRGRVHAHTHRSTSNGSPAACSTRLLADDHRASHSLGSFFKKKTPKAGGEGFGTPPEERDVLLGVGHDVVHYLLERSMEGSMEGSMGCGVVHYGLGFDAPPCPTKWVISSSSWHHCSSNIPSNIPSNPASLLVPFASAPSTKRLPGAVAATIRFIVPILSVNSFAASAFPHPADRVVAELREPARNSRLLHSQIRAEHVAVQRERGGRVHPLLRRHAPAKLAHVSRVECFGIHSRRGSELAFARRRGPERVGVR